MRWTESQTHLFAKIYLSYRYLWDTEDEHYRSKPKRLAAYRDIASKFHKLTNILQDEREVALKIKSLRSTYNIEINKMRENHRYRPKMKWFSDYHKCLRDHVVRSGKLSEERVSSYDDQDGYETDLENYTALTASINEDAKLQESCEMDSDKDIFVGHGDEDYEMPVVKKEPKFNDSESTDSLRKHRKRKNKRSYSSDNSRDTRETKKSCQSKDDEFDIYGKYIATQLRNMGLPRALKAQLKIQTIVSEARMDSLIDEENSANK